MDGRVLGGFDVDGPRSADVPARLRCDCATTGGHVQEPERAVAGRRHDVNLHDPHPRALERDRFVVVTVPTSTPAPVVPASSLVRTG